MLLNIPQLNRVAILIDDADQDVARVDPTPTHRLDGTVFVTVDGVPQTLNAAGELVPDYIAATFGLAAA